MTIPLSGARKSTPATAAAAAHASGGAAFQQLIGFAAYVRLRLFVEVAQHVWGTPDLDDAQRLLRRALHIGEQEVALAELGKRHFGLSAGELMRPFDGVFDSFLTRTQPKNWFEGLLRPVVTHGVSRDLIRIMARGLPPAEAKVVHSILADDGADDTVGPQLIRSAISADPVLGARLSLWGRRVVGEAFGMGTDLLRKNPELGKLLIRAMDDAAPGQLNLNAAQAAAIAELSADHQKRMELMGLSA